MSPPSEGVRGDVGVNVVCGNFFHHDFCESPTCFSDDDVDDPDYVGDVGDYIDSDAMHSEGDTSLVQGGDGGGDSGGGGGGDSCIGGGDVSCGSHEKKGADKRKVSRSPSLLRRRILPCTVSHLVYARCSSAKTLLKTFSHVVKTWSKLDRAKTTCRYGSCSPSESNPAL
ncbi:hypothetical protein SK128_007291, partial [Halocaridina rubra]